MALYTISDVHLSKSVNKPMDVFGHLWEDYENRLEKGFEKLTDEDVTVIPGHGPCSEIAKESMTNPFLLPFNEPYEE